MTYKRRGSLRFIKIGRFGFSWWWAKKKPTKWQQRYREFGDMADICANYWPGV